jgi:hypothetical protein
MGIPLTLAQADRARARAIGARAHDLVRDHYLAQRQLTETIDLVRELA